MALIGLLQIQENEPAITNRQVWLLILIGIGNFLSGCAQSYLPALFPLMAITKKQTTFQIAVVFAAFNLGRIFINHFDKRIMSLVTPKFLIVTGLFVSGGTNILFGCMQWSPGSVSFLALNSTLQLVNGMGMTMAFYAVVLLIGGGAFYSNAIYFIALIDSFGLIGLIVGAPLGTIIFSLNNYFTTFAILGLVIIMIALLCMAIFDDEAELTEWPSQDDFSIFVRFPLVWMSLLAIGINSAVDSYVLITLGNELQLQHLGHVAIGGMFLMAYLFTFAADMAVGSIVLRIKSNFFVISVGCLLLTLGLVFLGPAGFVQLKSQTGTLALGLVFKGLATGAISSSAVAGLLRAAKQQFPDDLTTFIMVIKLAFKTEYTGHFIGSLCTGPLYDQFGHSETTSVIAIVFSVLIGLFAIAHCLDKRRQNYFVIDDTPLCGCSMNHPEPHVNHSEMGLSTSIEPANSGEWNWLYGNNRTVL